MESIKGKVVNEKTMIVMADIGKDRHYGYWRCPDGTDVKPFAFWNDGRGVQEFWDRVSRAKNVHNIEEIVFGYESSHEEVNSRTESPALAASWWGVEMLPDDFHFYTSVHSGCPLARTPLKNFDRTISYKTAAQISIIR